MKIKSAIVKEFVKPIAIIVKSNLVRILSLALIIYVIGYCSSDHSELKPPQISSSQPVDYTYISSEFETLNLINDYRISIGINELEINNYLSHLSEEHNTYMIAANSVNHDGFVTRAQNIKNLLGATKVDENIAFNYNSPQAVFDAWMRSPKHKEIMTGNYTHFGISIRNSPLNGKKYYTNIFVKI